MVTIEVSHPQTIGGMISVLLFGAFFVKCTWRLVGAFFGYNDTQHRFYLHKLIFHAVFSLYSLFELSYAISMIIYDSNTSKWGYSLHLVALFFNLTLFLMLINVWGILLQDVKKTRNAACILLVLNLATIVWAVVDMHHKEEFEDFLLRDTLIISPTLLVKMTEEEISIKRLLLRRIKIVLMVFTMCYFCRVFVLVVLILSDNTEGTGARSLLNMPPLVWYLVSWWIPNVPPNIFFLAMMKMPPATDQKQKKPSLRGGGGGSGVVVNKMFADYDTNRSRESCPDPSEMEADEESWRYSDTTMGSRLSSKEVEMGRVQSAESTGLPVKSVIVAPTSDWALM